MKFNVSSSSSILQSIFFAPWAICLPATSKPPESVDPDGKAGHPNANPSCTSRLGKGMRDFEPHLIRIIPNQIAFLLSPNSSDLLTPIWFISSSLKDPVLTSNTSLTSTSTHPSICSVTVRTKFSLWESLAFLTSLWLLFPNSRARKSEGLEAT